jgi:hypothetical protein
MTQPRWGSPAEQHRIVARWRNCCGGATRWRRSCTKANKGNEDIGFDEGPDRDENKAPLMQVAPDKGAAFGYEYDFGDSWEHEITVEKILPPDPAAATAALCLDGARACPPEDCGGIWGYANLLKILKNRKHPEHKDMKAWVGGSFDAETFDPAHINLWLRKIKWPRVTEAQLRQVLMSRDDCRAD